MDTFHLHCTLSAVELFSQHNDLDTHLRYKGFTPESLRFRHEDKEEQVTDFDIFIIKDKVGVVKDDAIFLHISDEIEASIYIYLNEHQINKLISNNRYIDSILIFCQYTFPVDGFKETTDSTYLCIPFNSIEIKTDLSSHKNCEKVNQKSSLKWLLRNSYINKYSQIKRIIEELNDSANEFYIDYKIEHEEFLKIKAIISDLRPAYREWKDSPSGYNLWNEEPEDFLQSINTEPLEEQKLLKKQYDTLWQYFSINTILKLGEDKTLLKEGLNPKVEEIEGIAQRILSLKNVYSRTLEDIIVGSLINCEVVSYARYVSTKDKMLGFKVPTPIKANEDSALKTFIKEIFKTAVFYIKEILKITVTFAISTLLTEGNNTSSWVITSIFTVARWYFNQQNSKMNSEVIAFNLLSKMGSLDFYFSKNVINYQLLRAQLYNLESEGARFSPMVYEMIDRVISRNKIL